MDKDLLIRELLNRIKSDEEFFKKFLNFLEKNLEKREIILLILRRTILDSVKEIFND